MSGSKLSRLGWIWTTFFCLVATIAFTARSEASKKAKGGHISMSDRLPLEINGWIGSNIPLGSGEVLHATERLLNYDDYIYRVYRKAGEEIIVYAMFWYQGSISVREMAGHNPDSCWIGSGAKLLDDFKGPQAAKIPSSLNQFGEQRCFAFPGVSKPVFVTWWHIWGTEIVDSGFKVKSISAVLMELKVWLWDRGGQGADQIFVRVHGNKALNEISQNPVLLKFVSLFPVLSTDVQTTKRK